MKRVIVVGGGWSGVSAAICAKKAGADVILIEKTDLLLGAGNVGGIYRNNGRFTAAEEMIALGAGELFQAMDSCAELSDYLIKKSIRELERIGYNSRITFINNAKLCCGEGVCGACTKDIGANHSVHLCKKQLEIDEIKKIVLE